MKRTHVFTANDGTTHETASECKQYENNKILLDLLSDLSKVHVATALDRSDPNLADAFELAGNMIAAKRRKNGDFKRANKRRAHKSAPEELSN